MRRVISSKSIATSVGLIAAFSTVVGLGALGIVSTLGPAPSTPVMLKEALLIETGRLQLGNERIIELTAPRGSEANLDKNTAPYEDQKSKQPEVVIPQSDALPTPITPMAEPQRKLRSKPELEFRTGPRAPTAHAALSTPLTPQITPSPILRARPDPRLAGVLTLEEIRRIRNTLRLTPEQAAHWPPVEALLREIGVQQMALIKAGQKAEDAFGSGLSMRIYWAARPLLGVLQEDQKVRIRVLAKSMGLDAVASAI